MKKPDFIKPNNPVRAWSRRIVRGTKGRPDVGILQLQRRIEVLESVANLNERSSSWVESLVEALTPYQYSELSLSRFGSKHDGGYVLPDDLANPVTGVVSIGVGDNNDVDVQLAERGLVVHAWDHTVAGVPTPHDRITFHRVGLGDSANDGDLRSLADIVDHSFGPYSSGLLLLLDAEGAEWGQLVACPDETLDRFSVIAVEYHDLGDLIVDPTDKLAVLERLNTTFVPVAIHANNHAAVWRLPGLDLPDAIEVTYVNRRLLTSVGLPGNCAARLTSPCCPDLDEVLVSWSPSR